MPSTHKLVSPPIGPVTRVPEKYREYFGGLGQPINGPRGIVLFITIHQGNAKEVPGNKGDTWRGGGGVLHSAPDR